MLLNIPDRPVCVLIFKNVYHLVKIAAHSGDTFLYGGGVRLYVRSLRVYRHNILSTSHLVIGEPFVGSHSKNVISAYSVSGC